jgi:hypothetical protein
MCGPRAAAAAQTADEAHFDTPPSPLPIFQNGAGDNITVLEWIVSCMVLESII